MTMPVTDSKTRFSTRVENYVRYRPTYPEAVLDLIAREFGFTAQWKVADIGSGTGISAKLFLEFGNPVFAVEPNREMREAAEKLLGNHPNFHSLEGSAEATTLADNAVDLVVAAQAFHWFDPAAARTEFRRILRPQGVAVLMWNTRKIAGSPFLEDYEQLLLRFGIDYNKLRHDSVGPEKLREFFDENYHLAKVPNMQNLDYDGLKGRLLTSSYVPLAGQPGHDEMLDSLKAIFTRHQQSDRVTIEYETEIYWRRLRR